MPAAGSAESPRPGAESTGAYDAFDLLSCSGRGRKKSEKNSVTKEKWSCHTARARTRGVSSAASARAEGGSAGVEAGPLSRTAYAAPPWLGSLGLARLALGGEVSCGCSPSTEARSTLPSKFLQSEHLHDSLHMMLAWEGRRYGSVPKMWCVRQRCAMCRLRYTCGPRGGAPGSTRSTS